MLTNEQKTFLKDEFGITSEKLEKMSKDEWKEVRFKCFIIESEETELDDEGCANITEKGILAAKLADVSYKNMRA